MKIVQINTFSNGSTGSIMMNIHNALLEKGIDSYVVWGRGRKSNNENEIFLNDKLGVYFHAIYARLTGKVGFASKRSTKKLLRKLDEIKPDIIHLHNIHGYYINIEMLFNYIKKNNIRVIWTLHDCWSFTGHCPHFEFVDCNKWKKQCYNCPQKDVYPKTFFDNSKWCYEKKKKLFTGINDLTIVTPSKWLANLVKQSYLKNYHVEVINNGIDTNVFRILENDKLKFRKQYNLEDKIIILGVASDWTKRKGLNDFIELSKQLDDDYKIVLVGLKKQQLKKIPKSILCLKRTDTIEDLVDIYNSADVFFNPTHEDNYPTVNLESIACGTPVYTYNTGGSPEGIIGGYGAIVDFESFVKLLKEKKWIIDRFSIKYNFFCIKNIIIKYLDFFYKKRYK